MDDDFGDLYADVEVQATSSLNGVLDFTKLNIEPDDNNNSNKNTTTPGETSFSYGNKFSTTSDQLTRPVENGATHAPSLELDGSDSEDDLNILLNDEDCMEFPVISRVNGKDGGCEEEEDSDFVMGSDSNGLTKNRKLGEFVSEDPVLSCNNGAERWNRLNGGYKMHLSQYKYMRHQGPSFSKGRRVNGNIVSSSMMAKDDWEVNGWNQLKTSCSSKGSNVRANQVPECGYGFSLPWYRTILDVNIDTFEKKPWSYPGADITDFFNFGFNEKSWKGYCMSVETFRDQSSIQYKNPVHPCPKLSPDCNFGYDNEKLVLEEVADEITQYEPSSRFSYGERPSELPRGRAIQVENSIGDRQPTMDIWRPRNRDSDVVIQINVQDSMIDSPVSSKEQLWNINNNIQETSYNANSHQASSADKLSSGLEMCSKPVADTSKMPLNAKNQENGKICASIRINQVEMSACSSEEFAKEIEVMDEEVGEVHMNSNFSEPSIVETDLSLGDRIHFTPATSFSECGSEASEFQCDFVGVHSPLRQSITDLQETDFKSFERSGIKLNLEDDKILSRHSTTFSRKQKKHHFKRSHSDVNEEICAESDDDDLPISKAEDGRQRYARHKRSLRDERTCKSNRILIKPVQKMHPKNIDDDSPVSEAEIRDRDQRSENYRKRESRLHVTGYHGRDIFSYDREQGFSSGYGNESSAENNAHTVHPRYLYQKSHQRFREVDRYVRNCNRRGYFNERKVIVNGEDDIDRKLDHCERDHFIEDMNPRTFQESRWQHPHFSRNPKGSSFICSKQSDKLLFRKRTDYAGGLSNGEHEDNLLRDKHGRPFLFSDRQRDFLEKIYDREYPDSDQERYLSGRRDRHSNFPCKHLDLSCSIRSLKEYYPTKGARHDYANENKYDVFDVTGACGRQKRHILEEEGRDGWFGSSNYSKETNNSLMYEENLVQLGKRRYCRRSKVLHWTKGELITRHSDNVININEGYMPFEKPSMLNFCKYDSPHDERPIDDIKWRHHTYGRMKERKIAHHLDRNTKSMRTDEHEQTVLRCQDSVDLIVGEGKFRRGNFNGTRSVRNERVLQKDLKSPKTQRTPREPDQSCRWKTVPNLNIEDKQNTKERLGKFLNTKHNEVDIEDDQFTVKEPNKVDHFEKNSLSETAAQTQQKQIKTETSSNQNETDIDKQRLLETLAKMKKRRERFKEPAIVKNEPVTVEKKTETAHEFHVELILENSEPKKRPARKRRWGGS